MVKTTNAGSFAAGLGKFLQGVDKTAHKRVRKIAFAAWGGILAASPFDTGTFRANWMVAVNTIDMTVVEYPDATKKHPAPKRPYPDPNFQLGDSIYISNALPYANSLESGWSDQAPQGVVAPTKRALESKIKAGAIA